MLREQRFYTGTVEINVAEGPRSGPPLVLLHGGSSRWQSFQPMIPDLVQGWHVVAPDFRGHGRSGWTPGRYRLREYVADTAALLQQIGRPAVLFGLSLGGNVALMLAAQQAALVRAVITGDTPFDLENARRHILQTAEEARQRNIRSAHPVDPTMLASLERGFDVVFAGFDPPSLFPRIACPVLVLQADPAAGGVVTDEEVAAALPLLARATHVRLPGIGHRLFDPQKEPALVAVQRFLADLATRA